MKKFLSADLAVLMMVTSAAAIYGTGVQYGAEIAVEEINALGGFPDASGTVSIPGKDNIFQLCFTAPTRVWHLHSASTTRSWAPSVLHRDLRKVHGKG